MAGELEHIRPTDPAYGNLASRTRNINFVDANGVLRSITHVYWSPTNDPNDRKLIWQRDHTPVVIKYKNILNSNIWVMFKWTATQTTLNSIKIWAVNEGSGKNYINGNLYIYKKRQDGLGEYFTHTSSDIQNGDISIGTDTLNVNNADISVKTITITNIQNCGGMSNFTIGDEYYIFINPIYNGNLWVPIFYVEGESEYLTDDNNNEMWKLGQNQYLLHNDGFFEGYGTDKPKIEVNGVQI